MEDKNSCCSPSRCGSDMMLAAPLMPNGTRRDEEAVDVSGGNALLGTAAPVLVVDGEGPLHRTRLAPFRIGATAVTNTQFAAFIADTGYRTDAERFGWSFVFFAQLPDRAPDTMAVVDLQWWRRVDGAYWRDIAGVGVDCLIAAPDYPVVHVSWNDASAYAAWAGGRLPIEIEWEHAARGGLGDVQFPWGDREPDDHAYIPCNIWQGRFPDLNLGRDGFVATAPARSFEPNGFGLFNMVGNVWEWTADPFRVRTLNKAARAAQAERRGYRILKGGSFLCHKSYCFRYRIAARTGNSPDSTTSHQGFRVVWDH